MITLKHLHTCMNIIFGKAAPKHGSAYKPRPKAPLLMSTHRNLVDAQVIVAGLTMGS
ncbi:hypothetical protein CCACVL1_01528 [Corchorus capsularis]|uniref:Uncharacterized protein n=1 Tax=Corchorus capsularis TaxID=210143 RepID=A0A1R3KHG7_COCAP|nr:hypothetical protein CCACVL1_01528 [Corchorus capsularis]